jgi:hypothetical protein
MRVISLPATVQTWTNQPRPDVTCKPPQPLTSCVLSGRLPSLPQWTTTDSADADDRILVMRKRTRSASAGWSRSIGPANGRRAKRSWGHGDLIAVIHRLALDGRRGSFHALAVVSADDSFDVFACAELCLRSGDDAMTSALS